MHVLVKCYAALRTLLPDADDTHTRIPVAEAATVADLMLQLAVPESIPVVTLVNQQQVQPEHALTEGDLVDLFPPIAGG